MLPWRTQRLVSWFRVMSVHIIRPHIDIDFVEPPRETGDAHLVVTRHVQRHPEHPEGSGTCLEATTYSAVDFSDSNDVSSSSLLHICGIPVAGCRW